MSASKLAEKFMSDEKIWEHISLTDKMVAHISRQNPLTSILEIKVDDQMRDIHLSTDIEEINRLHIEMRQSNSEVAEAVKNVFRLRDLVDDDRVTLLGWHWRTSKPYITIF
jgi:hypothetical protein